MPRIKTSPYHRRMEADSNSLGDCSSGPGGEVTVVDVYDIASDIGKECEKIIDKHGADAVTSLMPKVINALELLENLATRNERENTLLNEMQLKISQLENDKLEKAEYRQKFEKELESIEEQWRSETKELLTMVSKLQEDNKKLQKISQNTPSKQSPTTPTDGRGEIIQKLQDTLEKQRDEIREKEKILQERSIESDNLRSQIDRLTSTAKDLRRKNKLMQMQVRTLCDERADFLAQMQDQHRDITALKQRLGLAQKENEDLSKCDLPLPANKVIYDLEDPNRPRFTIQELKDILHERNELKAKVSDLEDELVTYRPKKKIERQRSLIGRIENACESYLGIDFDRRSGLIELNPAYFPEEEDPPVQGPLPYEPDDAPWKKEKESGIRKFFRKIFSDNNDSGTGNGGFPRRSLSTLSKMALSSTTTDPVAV